MDFLSFYINKLEIGRILENFQLRAGRMKTVHEFLRNMNIDNVVEMVYPRDMNIISTPTFEE